MGLIKMLFSRKSNPRFRSSHRRVHLSAQGAKNAFGLSKAQQTVVSRSVRKRLGY